MRENTTKTTQSESTATGNSAESQEETTSFKGLPTEQIDKLRDAFQLIDNNNDGNISKEDLQKTYESIGQECKQETLVEMFAQFKEDISFTGYLSLLSHELAELPNRNEIKRALQVFDQDTEINARDLKESLLSVGMSASDIDSVLNAFKSERMNGEQMFMGKEFLQFVSS